MNLGAPPQPVLRSSPTAEGGLECWNDGVAEVSDFMPVEDFVISRCYGVGDPLASRSQERESLGIGEKASQPLDRVPL